MNSQKISVIIVTFNNENEIKPCIDSIKNNNYNHQVQIILIDNNSSDKTVTNIDRNIENLEFIRNNKNAGFTKAVNQGLKMALGDYILLLNPDTELPVDTFPKLIPLFEKNHQIGIIAPQFLNKDNSIQPSCRRLPQHRDVFFHIFGLNYIFPQSEFFNSWKMGDFNHTVEKYVDQPQGAFLLIQRRALDDVGLLDEQFPMFFSDVDWCHRFLENNWKILFTPEIKIVHHKGRSIYQNRIPLIWSSHISFYHYFKKYYRGRLWTVINLITGIVLMKLAVIRILFIKINRKLCELR